MNLQKAVAKRGGGIVNWQIVCAAVGLALLLPSTLLTAEAAEGVRPYKLSVSPGVDIADDGCTAIRVQPVVVLPEESEAVALDVVAVVRGMVPPFADAVLEEEVTVASWKVPDSGDAQLKPVNYIGCVQGEEPVRVEFALVAVDASTGKRIVVDSRSSVLEARHDSTVVLAAWEVVDLEEAIAESAGLQPGEQMAVVTPPPTKDEVLLHVPAVPPCAVDGSCNGGDGLILDSGTGISFYGYWKYLESRTNCEPAEGSGGSTDAFFRCSTQGTYKGLRGLRVELWRLRGGNWTLITTTNTNSGDGSGWYTSWSSADWEETDQFKTKVFLERVVDGEAYGNWRWRCLNDGGLTNASTPTVYGTVQGGYLSVNLGSVAILGEESRICATMQDAWLVHGSNSDLQDDVRDLEVNHWIETDPRVSCPVDCTGRYEIRLCRRSDDDSVWKNGYIAAHEFGHVLHRHSQDGVAQHNYDWGDYSEGWHSWTSAEWEETVLHEGIANFVSTSSFYGPGASDPMYHSYHVSEAPNGGGDPVCVESHFPDGSPPERNEGNYTRYMWDIFDSVNDDAWTDSLNLSSSTVFAKYYLFPSGTSNRQRSESDYDGPNVWDYYYHMYYSGSPTYNSVNQVYSNCLEDSDWN